MNKNILVTGSNGQLATQIKNIVVNKSNHNYFFKNKIELDVTNHKLVNKFVNDYNIHVIINCAAFTDVEKAEYCEELADKINHLAVKNLAKVVKEYRIGLIHISTDYIFDGEKKTPYKECDKARPLNNYGKTKLNGELALKKINPENSMIIRTSWLYSKNGNNFYTKIIELSKSKNLIDVVSDQFGSPTNALSLAKAIIKVIDDLYSKNLRIYHFSDLGICSRYDFAKSIINQNGIDIKIRPIKSSELKSNVKRPAYSALDSSAFKNDFNYTIKHYKETLKL